MALAAQAGLMGRMGCVSEAVGSPASASMCAGWKR
jgi:hypothetical protein